MAVEEMIVATKGLEQNQGRSVWFDVRVSVLPEHVQIVLRDDGAIFDPTIKTGEAKEEPEADGITFVATIASSIAHAQTLGMNQTIIRIARP